MMDPEARLASLERENQMLRSSLEDVQAEVTRLSPWEPEAWRMKVIAVDFDGVLHDHAGCFGPVPVGPPVEGALEGVKRLIASGASLVVHSARLESPEGWEGVVSWLDENGFPSMPLTIGKPNAKAYLDDRAIRFVDWDEALRSVLRLL